MLDFIPIIFFFNQGQVENISATLKGNKISSYTYTSNEASESKMKSFENPKILHIATHGFFMENEAATHLFFIDADIEFNPEDILRMVAYDKPITVGAYPKKAINWNSIIGAARNPDLNETEETIEGHSSNYVVNFDFVSDKEGNKTPQVQIEDNLVKLKDFR